MTLDTIRFPLDPSGINQANRVTREPHTLPNRKVRVFVPDAGAFYVKSVVLYDGNTGIPLTKDQWKPAELDREASVKYGANICYVVLITDPTVGSLVYIDYQAVGGRYMTAAAAVISQIEALKLDDRTVAYKDITGKPTEYPVSPHLHDAGDIYGMEYVTHAIDRVKATLETTDAASHDTVLKYIDTVESMLLSKQSAINTALAVHVNDTKNPHRVTAAQLNAYTKTEVDSYIAAVSSSLAQHTGNFNNPHKVTAAQLNAYTKPEIDTFVQTTLTPVAAALQAHIVDYNNPHKVTPALVGTYSKDEIDSMTSGVISSALAHIANTNNPHNVTASQIGAYSKDEIDALITAHTSRTDNPHQLSAAQLNAYTKAEADALLATKLAAANAVTVDIFNALWDKRMNDRFTFTMVTPVNKYDLVIPSNVANYNIYNAAIAAGWDGKTAVTFTVTINSGVIVYASNTGTAALDMGAGPWPAGMNITIINNGIIAGAGGNGGGEGWDYIPGYPGGAGGPGFIARAPVSFRNNGTIAGGGGGGGGGGGVYGTPYPSGGGGGQGYNNAPGGNSGQAGGGGSGSGAAPGLGGTKTGGGGQGGNGGAWGKAGAPGGAGAASAGGAGGAAGVSVVNGQYITWLNTGTLIG